MTRIQDIGDLCDLIDTKSILFLTFQARTILDTRTYPKHGRRIQQMGKRIEKMDTVSKSMTISKNMGQQAPKYLTKNETVSKNYGNVSKKASPYPKSDRIQKKEYQLYLWILTMCFGHSLKSKCYHENELNFWIAYPKFGCLHGRTDARTDCRTVGWSVGRSDGWSGGRTDGWTVGRMD